MVSTYGLLLGQITRGAENNNDGVLLQLQRPMMSMAVSKPKFVLFLRVVRAPDMAGEAPVTMGGSSGSFTCPGTVLM